MRHKDGVPKTHPGPGLVNRGKPTAPYKYRTSTLRKSPQPGQVYLEPCLPCLLLLLALGQDIVRPGISYSTRT